MREEEITFEKQVLRQIEKDLPAVLGLMIGGKVEVRGKTGSSITLKHTQKDGLVKSYVVKIKES